MDGYLGFASRASSGFFLDRTVLAAENLAPRQQLNVLQRSVKRVRLRRRDRVFWSLLSRIWNGWRSSLMIVKPETVIRWHRHGFRLYWRWKSRKGGRPRKDAEIRVLIRRMSREHPTWGAPIYPEDSHFGWTGFWGCRSGGIIGMPNESQFSGLGNLGTQYHFSVLPKSVKGKNRIVSPRIPPPGPP